MLASEVLEELVFLGQEAGDACRDGAAACCWVGRWVDGLKGVDGYVEMRTYTGDDVVVVGEVGFALGTAVDPST